MPVLGRCCRSPLLIGTSTATLSMVLWGASGNPPDVHCTRPLTSTGFPLTCSSTWQRTAIPQGTRRRFELHLLKLATRWRQRTTFFFLWLEKRWLPVRSNSTWRFFCHHDKLMIAEVEVKGLVAKSSAIYTVNNVAQWHSSCVNMLSCVLI